MDRIQSRAARLQRLEHNLYNAPQGLRAIELAERCGVDRRTIYRDIDALGELGVPVWQDGPRYGIDRESYLSTVRLNLNEAIALYFAVRLLAHHSDEHNPHVVAALSKLSSSLPDSTIAQHISRAAESIRAKPLRTVYIRALEAITRAWADKRQVRLHYRSASGELTERVVNPYFLEASRSEPASYVIGHDDLRGAIRTFKIERVVQADVLEQSYSIPDDFDPYSYLASSWSVMNEREVEVWLRFSSAVAERVRESVWHHSQRIENLADGGCELRVLVGGVREIRAWVLGWGADVEVLDPPELRADVADHARRMAAHYTARAITAD
ncbi:MAG: WYL domain-containing protein [Roseiflexaceae bacterium]|nr:WYL domain-containing protein [Roseiflexaceae bacterium]